MLKVFNKQAITKKQRFSRALLVGSISTAILLAILILLYEIYGIYVSPLFYLAFGFAIGYVICEYGRGVQIQFSILAAGLTFILIFVYDLVCIGSLADLLAYLFSTDLFSILDIVYRVGAIALAYSKARIIR